MGVTTRDLLDHLMDWYSNITAANIKANESRINEAFIIHVLSTSFYNASMMLYSMLMTRKPIYGKKKLQTAFHSVNATGIYQEACKEWQKKGDADKTWTNLKPHFSAEYHKIHEQKRVSGEAGFNSNQLAHETTDMATSLENMELTAMADRNIVSDLIAINKKLVETNTALVVQVKSLVATNARIANTQGTESQKMPRATITREPVHIFPNRYCCSHGFKVRMVHSSIACGGKLQGHRDDARQTNTLNGKIWNKTND